MTKVTYKRKHLIGALPSVPEGESMPIMVGSMVVGRQSSTRAVAESLHLSQKQRQGGRETAPDLDF